MIYNHICYLSSLLNQKQTTLILDFLKNPPKEDQKFFLDGEDLVAITQTFSPKEFCEGRYESHYVYSDLQIMLSGEENIFYHPIVDLEIDEENIENDIMFYKKVDKGQSLPINTEMFMILHPEDGHMPSIKRTEQKTLRKVVFKLKRN